MHNVLKISKTIINGYVRLRLIFQFTYVQYCTCKLNIKVARYFVDPQVVDEVLSKVFVKEARL